MVNCGCIYRLTNTVTGRIYIGKTIDFKNRMKSHKNHKNGTYLSNSIRKHGWDKFKIEILIQDVPEEDLSNLEISYIEVENTMSPNGYNLTKGGEGVSGYKHTEETRRNMTQTMIKRQSNRKQFGSICYRKDQNYWRVLTPYPQRDIGRYFTKEKARKALNYYNETGECMDSDRKKRKKGTGTFYPTLNGRYQARYVKNKKEL